MQRLHQAFVTLRLMIYKVKILFSLSWPLFKYSIVGIITKNWIILIIFIAISEMRVRNVGISCSKEKINQDFRVARNITVLTRNSQK